MCLPTPALARGRVSDRPARRPSTLGSYGAATPPTVTSMELVEARGEVTAKVMTAAIRIQSREDCRGPAASFAVPKRFESVAPGVRSAGRTAKESRQAKNRPWESRQRIAGLPRAPRHWRGAECSRVKRDCKAGNLLVGPYHLEITPTLRVVTERKWRLEYLRSTLVNYSDRNRRLEPRYIYILARVSGFTGA